MNYNPDKLSIKAWAENDRPREKLLLQGRRALSDAELIAILIGSGSRNETAVELSKRILHQYQNNLSAISKLSVQELCRFKGIGEAKAISIIAALELGRRRKDDGQSPEKILSSRDVYYALKAQFSDLLHEEFWVIYVNRANNVLAKCLISKGGVSGTMADPKIIFKTGFEYNAVSMFLAHNHPSESLRPSQEDIVLTRRLVESGRLMQMTILDHVIFGGENFYSFADNALL